MPSGYGSREEYEEAISESEDDEDCTVGGYPIPWSVNYERPSWDQVNWGKMLLLAEPVFGEKGQSALEQLNHATDVVCRVKRNGVERVVKYTESTQWCVPDALRVMVNVEFRAELRNVKVYCERDCPNIDCNNCPEEYKEQKLDIETVTVDLKVLFPLARLHSHKPRAHERKRIHTPEWLTHSRTQQFTCGPFVCAADTDPDRERLDRQARPDRNPWSHHEPSSGCRRRGLVRGLRCLPAGLQVRGRL